MKRQHSFLAAFALLVLFSAAVSAIAAPQSQSAAQQDDDSGKVDPSKLISGKWMTTLSGKPYVLDVIMENAPVPTAGHWNIMDIYSPGERKTHVST